MSRMLSFFDAAWASAHQAAMLGRRADARAFLTPLLTSPEAPARLTLLAHRLAAQLAREADKYVRARRHLREAARIAPTDPEIQYHLGLAFEEDPYGCDWRAARRFRHALRLDPSQPKYAAALGRALVRTNRLRSGVQHLLTAASQAPGDMAVLAVVVEGLREAGRVRLARTLIQRALFLNPQNAAARHLWNEIRYATAQKKQSRARSRGLGSVEPRVLSFPAESGSDRVVVRRDMASRTGPHLGRLRAYRAEQG